MDRTYLLALNGRLQMLKKTYLYSEPPFYYLPFCVEVKCDRVVLFESNVLESEREQA